MSLFSIVIQLQANLLKNTASGFSFGKIGKTGAWNVTAVSKAYCCCSICITWITNYLPLFDNFYLSYIYFSSDFMTLGFCLTRLLYDQISIWIGFKLSGGWWMPWGFYVIGNSVMKELSVTLNFSAIKCFLKFYNVTPLQSDLKWCRQRRI